MKYIKPVWAAGVSWFENGDLVPVMVLISAVHYAAVLAGKDAWLVAVAIGLLVDLGHYRTVRAAVRYSGDDWRQIVTRWIIAAGMTALSLNYHQRYYDDWWLSIPLPLLIAALAWLQRVDRVGAKPVAKKETEAQQPAQPVAQPSTRERILALHHAQPDATHETIAQRVGVSRQRVGAIIRQNGKN